MAKNTGLASIASGTSDLHAIDPSKLKVQPGWNSRDFNDPENAQYVEDMCANIIAAGGVKRPIIVKFVKGEAFIRDGECRWRGAMLAISRGHALKTVPVQAADRYADEKEELFNQRLHNSGKPYSIFEDAKHFKRLIDMGETEENIAIRCMISKTRVVQILEHNTVGKVGKDAVVNGQASASLVMQVTKELGSEAEQALKKGLEKAKKEGKKLKPDHIEELKKTNVRKAVVEAFEYADVDDTDDEVIVVKFPVDKWNVLRDILKL